MKMLKYFVTASRILVGLVFIFSSFVKGVDPLGTTYKIEEYMLVFGTTWALPLAFTLSSVLCTAEFVIGVLLLTNACKKVTKWLLLLMMTFFLVTTFIDAVTNKVTDCGCFGDAIKLTNWETFWKNVALMLPTFIIFFGQSDDKKKSRKKELLLAPKDIFVFLCSIVAMVSFCLYNYYNEPMLDFRPWKVGNHIMPKERGEVKSFLKYKNIATGEEIEFRSADLMKYYEDTNWANTWEFMDSKVVDPNEIAAPGFSMLDVEGTDHAKDLIGASGYLFIGASYDITKASNEGIQEMEEFAQEVMEKGYDFVFLTASLQEEIEKLQEAEKGFQNISFYLADDKAIKTMIRSNPGLVLLKNGTVIGKWHYRNIPDLEDINFSKLATKYKAD